MECLAVPVSVLVRRCSGRYSSSRLGYRPLADAGMLADGDLVTVVVGREGRQFLVDSYVLQESPFRVLIETAMKGNSDHHKNRRELENYMNNGINTATKTSSKSVIFVDVDAILFEHMLWLMYNDCSSFFKLNVKEIIDFYAQDY